MNSKQQILEDLDSHLREQMENNCQHYMALCTAAGIPYRDAIVTLTLTVLMAAASLVATETNAPVNTLSSMFAKLVAGIRRQEAAQSATDNPGRDG